ncbi:MAG: hypothetical protein RH946_14455 [Rhodospirillales bacterium]
MMNKSITFYFAIFCIGAGVGSFTFTATALETRWLYTESDFKRSLAYQEVQDLADVCGAIGKREWAEDDKSFKRLRGWGNQKLRKLYASDILTEMQIASPRIERIKVECATRLSAT